MKKHKFLLTLLVCIALFIIYIYTNDSSSKKEPISDPKNNIIWHDMNNLDKLTREDVYTYDEMLSYLTNNGYTYSEANNMMGSKPTETQLNQTSEVYYSTLKMNKFKYSNKKSTTRYEVQARFVIGLEYIDSQATPNRIVSISDAQLYTGDCSFEGTVSYRLQDGKSFFYTFYGDLYLSEQEQWSKPMPINIGGFANVSSTVSNTDGYITNISESETYSSSALNP